MPNTNPEQETTQVPDTASSFTKESQLRYLEHSLLPFPETIQRVVEPYFGSDEDENRELLQEVILFLIEQLEKTKNEEPNKKITRIALRRWIRAIIGLHFKQKYQPLFNEELIITQTAAGRLRMLEATLVETDGAVSTDYIQFLSQTYHQDIGVSSLNLYLALEEMAFQLQLEQRPAMISQAVAYREVTIRELQRVLTGVFAELIEIYGDRQVRIFCEYHGVLDLIDPTEIDLSGQFPSKEALAAKYEMTIEKLNQVLRKLEKACRRSRIRYRLSVFLDPESQFEAHLPEPPAIQPVLGIAAVRALALNREDK